MTAAGREERISLLSPPSLAICMPLASQALPFVAAVGAVLLSVLAEALHERRCRVAAMLATGPLGRPRRWVRTVPTVRAVALGAAAWALVTLYFVNGGGFAGGEGADDRGQRPRLVFVLDLSPSMLLKDAGVGRAQTRVDRMHDVVDGILQRVTGNVLYSVIAFYTDALPAIKNSDDPNLVRNSFGLPMWYAMTSGKTDLGKAMTKSMALLTETLENKPLYPPGSTTVFICTDGDTLDLGALAKPPPAVKDLYVLGVGDPHQGSFIDGHMSRQDPSVLRTVAGRLRGQYIDVNEKHVATPTLGALATDPAASKHGFTLLEWAIVVLAGAAVVHASIPMALEYLGSDWKPVRAARREPAGT